MVLGGFKLERVEESVYPNGWIVCRGEMGAEDRGTQGRKQKRETEQGESRGRQKRENPEGDRRGRIQRET